MCYNKDNFSEINLLLRDGINRNLNRLGWNLRTLSEKSGTPYETLKKLANAKTENPSLINVLKISNAFQITPDDLLGFAKGTYYYKNFINSHSKHFVKALIHLENKCDYINKINATSDFIPLLTPIGNMHDATLYNSFMLSILDISKYNQVTTNNIFCAIKITSDSFIPIMQMDDIILICPEENVHNKIYFVLYNQHIYFRRYLAFPNEEYIPITPTSDSCTIYPNEHIHVLGYIDSIVSKDEL